MAEKFGWTLDYIDGLPVSELFQFLQIEEGRAKATKELSKSKRRGR